MNIPLMFTLFQIANNIGFGSLFPCSFIIFGAKVLREKEGIPDLRRAARYRYANVTLPEVSNDLVNEAIVLYKHSGALIN